MQGETGPLKPGLVGGHRALNHIDNLDSNDTTAWTAADMAEVDAYPANRRTVDPMPYARPSASGRPASVRPPTPQELADVAARMLREVPTERARLAAEDPAGEADAVAPLSEVRARQVMLEAEGATEARTARRRLTVIRGGRTERESGRDLLTRLGVDPSRDRGRVPCPAHGGRGRNLAASLASDGTALLTCHSHHCSFAAILEAIR